MTTSEEVGELFEFTGENDEELLEEQWEFAGQVGESVLGEEQEAALVAELLEISTEDELDEFLGKLARRAIRSAGRFVRSPIGKVLGGIVKGVAKTALPMVGGALGSMVLPGVGTALGSKLGSMAGSLLEEEELASLGEAQAEELAAQRFVRWAGATYRNAARTPRSVPPRAAARAAAISAARLYAPGLIGRQRGWAGRRRRRGYRPRYGYDYSGWDDRSADPYAAPPDQATSGRWVRRGNTVTLIGL
ncbi:hypothetical protein [Nocardia sp. CA-290969]|uniref:hypothetical protein n=1 Tax=Nocardia sp. CA-290969 TaxID=3239986 RepID=UPI003D8A51A4